MTITNIRVRPDNLYFTDNANLIFEDANSFSQYIEMRAVREKKTCMELVLDFCEKRSIDVDEIAELISKPLKEKIRVEMIAAGIKKKTENTLDDIDE